MDLLRIWRWQGTVTAVEYLTVGLAGFVVKTLLDQTVARALGRPDWTWWSYWRFVATPSDLPFAVGMIATAIPFIWAGTAMTLKRLRALGLPPVWVIGFFIPFLNLLLFLALIVTPARERTTSQVRSWPAAWTTFWGAIAIVQLPGLALVLLSLSQLQFYGLGIFVGIPFFQGMASALLYNSRKARGLGECLGIAAVAGVSSALSLLVLGIEGLLCIAMAAPLCAPIAMLGGAAGYMIRKSEGSSEAAWRSTALLPLLLVGEWGLAPTPPSYQTTSAVEINATPEQVWDLLVAFPPIPEPREWFFQTGIAYPIAARISGRGVGAVRECIFTTGTFVEPIDVWDAPRLLRFRVDQSPVPMREISIYPNLDPPHLHGFFVSTAGQFQLERMPGGRTRVSGTTWYRHSLWPAAYWRLYSEEIIHRIHYRVLHHLQRVAEARP